MVTVERHPLGPRVRVLGVRIHHWVTGAALVVVGVVLIWDDRADLPHRTRALPAFDPQIGVTTSHGPW